MFDSFSNILLFSEKLDIGSIPHSTAWSCSLSLKSNKKIQWDYEINFLDNKVKFLDLLWVLGGLVIRKLTLWVWIDQYMILYQRYKFRQKFLFFSQKRYQTKSKLLNILNFKWPPLFEQKLNSASNQISATSNWKIQKEQIQQLWGHKTILGRDQCTIAWIRGCRVQSIHIHLRRFLKQMVDQMRYLTASKIDVQTFFWERTEGNIKIKIKVFWVGTLQCRLCDPFISLLFWSLDVFWDLKRNF